MKTVVLLLLWYFDQCEKLVEENRQRQLQVAGVPQTVLNDAECMGCGVGGGNRYFLPTAPAKFLARHPSPSEHWSSKF